MTTIIVSIFTTIIYTLACLFLGLILIRFLFRKEKIETQFSLYALLASGFFLGQGILVNIWLFLGLASWFKVFLIWAILIVTIILGILLWPFSSIIWLKIKEDLAKIKKLSFIWKVFLFLVGLLILFYALASIILPPSGDAEAFYMVLPKIMAFSERLRPQPNYYAFSQIGLFGEMHFAALMAIASLAAAKFFTWFTALGTAILLLSIANFCGAKIKGQIMALIMLFTSTTFTYYITDGKVDIYGAALGLAAYYWVLQTNKKNNLLPLILTGLFAGLAIVAKYSNALVILPGIFLVIGWNNYLRARLNHLRLKEFFLYLFFSLLVVGVFIILAITPHLIKNWILFDEPLAPFVFLKSQGWQWLEQSWYSKETTRFILLTYPIGLIFGQYPAQFGNLSVLVLAFFPLLLFTKIQKQFWQSKLFQVILLAIIGLGLWMIARPSVLAPRYLLATLLLFIVPVAIGFEKVLLGNISKLLKYFLVLSVFFVLFCSVILILGPAQHYYKIFSGKISIDTLKSPYYNSLKFLNSHATKGERIFFAGYYSYYLKPDLLECMDDPRDTAQMSEVNNSKIWDILFQRGFNYILVQKDSQKYMLNLLDDNKKPELFDTEKIYDDDFVTIFSLRSKEPNNPSQCQCLSQNFKAWEVVCQ